MNAIAISTILTIVIVSCMTITFLGPSLLTPLIFYFGSLSTPCTRDEGCDTKQELFPIFFSIMCSLSSILIVVNVTYSLTL